MSEVTTPLQKVVVEFVTTKWITTLVSVKKIQNELMPWPNIIINNIINLLKYFAILLIMLLTAWLKSHASASETQVASIIINCTAIPAAYRAQQDHAATRRSRVFNGTPPRCSVLHRHVNLEAEL